MINLEDMCTWSCDGNSVYKLNKNNVFSSENIAKIMCVIVINFYCSKFHFNYNGLWKLIKIGIIIFKINYSPSFTVFYYIKYTFKKEIVQTIFEEQYKFLEHIKISFIKVINDQWLRYVCDASGLHAKKMSKLHAHSY